MIEQIWNLLNDISRYGLEKMGLYYSTYRGWVADNNDPEGLGRLKLSVPDIYGDKVYDKWAWPTSCFSGANYGSQVLPQKNDLVWVSFERGNPRKPLWSFGYFGRSEKPVNLRDVNSFWFLTPKGNLIEFNDTTGIITIKAGASEIEVQPAVLGTKNKENHEELIDILLSAKTNTALGPQPFLPDTLEKLNQLKEKLPESLSQKIKHN